MSARKNGILSDRRVADVGARRSSGAACLDLTSWELGLRAVSDPSTHLPWPQASFACSCPPLSDHDYAALADLSARSSRLAPLVPMTCSLIRSLQESQ